MRILRKSRFLIGIALTLTLLSAQESLVGVAKETKKSAQSQPSGIKTYTNDDLKKFEGDVPSAPANSKSIPKTVTLPPIPADLRQGGTQFYGDEAYWRKRTADLSKAKSDSETAASDLQLQLNLKWNQFYAMDDPAQRDQINIEINMLTKKLEETNQKLQKTTSDLDNLSDEGRKAGALPGWLRQD